MKNIKLTAVFALATLLVLSTACARLDVVGAYSAESFEAVLKVADDKVSVDEQNAGWSLAAPDGTVRFVWSADYSKSLLYDVLLAFDASPFINAGLIPDNLPDIYTVEGDVILVGSKLGKDSPRNQAQTTPLAAYRQLADSFDSIIGYHSAMDHYNVDMGDGNLFEWAKDLDVNTVDNSNQDKDIVFVLNPEPLILAGVDPQRVEGWVYATVTMGMGATAQEVYKFLKPFDLK